MIQDGTAQFAVKNIATEKIVNKGIKDVVKVDITSTIPDAANGNVSYCVRNGICFIDSDINYPLKSTGGEASHTLSCNEMPVHNRSLKKIYTYQMVLKVS